MTTTKRRLSIFVALLVFAAAGFNITRLMEPGASDLRIVINIPASRMDVYERGEKTRSFAISAGRREFATPAGQYKISQVIWNPWWHPPKSEWARNEKRLVARAGLDAVQPLLARAGATAEELGATVDAVAGVLGIVPLAAR